MCPRIIMHPHWLRAPAFLLVHILRELNQKLVSPIVQGDGVARCIQTAMKNAGVQPEEVTCRFHSSCYLYLFLEFNQIHCTWRLAT